MGKSRNNDKQQSGRDQERKQPRAKHGPVAKTDHPGSCQCNGTGQIIVGMGGAGITPMACPGR